MKRIVQTAAFLALATGFLFSQQPVNHGTSARSTAAWTSATSIDTTLAMSTVGMSMVNLTLNPTTTFTAGTLNFELSDDGGATWYATAVTRPDTYTVDTTYLIVASTKRSWQVNVAGWTNFRIRINPAITGTGTATLGMIGIAAGSVPSVVVGQATAANLNATVKITDGTTTPGVIVGTTALKTDMSSVAGTATSTATAGVQDVNVKNIANTAPTVKAASTAAAATDTAIVVAQSPNGGNPCLNSNATLSFNATTTSGTTAVQIIALSGSTKVYICSLSVVGQSGTGPTFSLVYGTGANCVTGQAKLVQPFATTANTMFAFANPVAVTPAGQAVCYLDAGTTPIQIFNLTYVQQ